MTRILFAVLLLSPAFQEDEDSPNLKAGPDVPAAAVEADKKGWELLEEYKKTYKDRELVDKAVEEFKKAERLAGKPFPLAAYHLGIAYQHTEDYKEAKRKLERVIELSPKFHEAFLELGDTFAWLKQYDSAIRTYDKALEIKPDFAHAMRNKGLAHMRKSDFEAAKKFIDKALEIKSDDKFGEALKKIVDKEVEGPKFAKEFRKETAHFAVVTNVDDRFTEWIGRHIELIYAKYESIFPKQNKGKDKYRVIVFNTVKEYMDYGSPPNTGGYYQDLTKKLVFWKQPKDSDTLLVLYHETFHQFLAYYLDHAPQWFNEGHGDYFGPSTYNEKTKQMEIRTNPWRLKGIQQGIQSGRYTPVTKLMQMTQAEMYDPKTVGMNYAEAWSLVYFFWHFENGKYAKLLQQYFQFLSKDEDLKGAYEAVFAKQDMAKIEEEWKKFTLGLKEQ
jgi:Flp pilus assembly protein TadD